MSSFENIMLHRYHRRWEWIIAGVVAVAATGIICVVLANAGMIKSDPWLYLGLAAAAVSGVAGMVLTLMEAILEESTTSARTRLRAEERIKIRQDRHNARK